MATNFTIEDTTPRKYVKRKGLARIDVTIHRQLIEYWLDEKYSAESIYKALVAKGIVQGNYTYRTFLRALHLKILNAKRSDSLPVTQKVESLPDSQHYNIAKETQSRSAATSEAKHVTRHETVIFSIPSNNITGDD
ncbi:hypothetical protein [Desulfovibrio sp. TomC]|jgi:hypothetical protein|uniref:hypothetical protein n=1 Tax=Desulfovibrio sp. TomC TaxID=1562888 RepID=UPI0012E1F7AD|nr:hypothetical protein [Desulfovibrio sp. TomC]